MSALPSIADVGRRIIVSIRLSVYAYEAHDHHPRPQQKAPIEADALAPFILLSYPLVNDDAVGLMLRKSIRIKYGGKS